MRRIFSIILLSAVLTGLLFPQESARAQTAAQTILQLPIVASRILVLDANYNIQAIWNFATPQEEYFVLEVSWRGQLEALPEGESQIVQQYKSLLPFLDVGVTGKIYESSQTFLQKQNDVVYRQTSAGSAEEIYSLIQ